MIDETIDLLGEVFPNGISSSLEDIRNRDVYVTLEDYNDYNEAQKEWFNEDCVFQIIFDHFFREWLLKNKGWMQVPF